MFKMKKLALALTLVAMLTVACKKAQQPQQTTQPADTTQVQPAESTQVQDTTATK
jgi:PBP1b-binding outer membrane lipoprotein LpoB